MGLRAVRSEWGGSTRSASRDVGRRPVRQPPPRLGVFFILKVLLGAGVFTAPERVGFDHLVIPAAGTDRARG